MRRLGEFHPTLSTATATDAQDLDDPLYGNARDASEKVLCALLFGDVVTAASYWNPDEDSAQSTQRVRQTSTPASA